MEDTRDLRKFLVEQMKGVSTGRVNIDRAKATSNLAQQVYNTLTVEVRMAKAMAEAKKLGIEVTPVKFGD